MLIFRLPFSYWVYSSTDTLVRLAKPGDVLLFKGSRGMHMELILDAFLKQTKKVEE